MTSIPVQVEPVVLGPAYCPTSYQELNLAMMRARWSVDLGSISTFVTREDAPDHTQYPDSIWIKLDGNGAPLRAYKWAGDPTGRWISPHPVPPGGELRMWTGTLDELKLYEGDAASSISPVANPTFEGPFWEPVLELSGRVPIGVNDATVGGPDETLPKYALGAVNTGTVNDPLGTLRLTDSASLPQHCHPVGKAGPDDTIPTQGDDVFLMYTTAPSPISEFDGPGTGITMYSIPGESDSFTSKLVTLFDIYTFDSTNIRVGSSTREVTPVNVLPPIRGVYFIRRTARLYYSEL